MLGKYSIKLCCAIQMATLTMSLFTPVNRKLGLQRYLAIDLSDQMSSYHSPLRMWFHKLAMELLLGRAIVNAHCLYNARQCSIGREPICQLQNFENVSAVVCLVFGHQSKSADNVRRAPASELMTATMSHPVHYPRQCSERGGARQDR